MWQICFFFPYFTCIFFLLFRPFPVNIYRHYINEAICLLFHLKSWTKHLYHGTHLIKFSSFKCIHYITMYSNYCLYFFPVYASLSLTAGSLRTIPYSLYSVYWHLLVLLLLLVLVLPLYITMITCKQLKNQNLPRQHLRWALNFMKMTLIEDFTTSISTGFYHRWSLAWSVRWSDVLGRMHCILPTRPAGRDRYLFFGRVASSCS